MHKGDFGAIMERIDQLSSGEALRFDFWDTNGTRWSDVIYSPVSDMVLELSRKGKVVGYLPVDMIVAVVPVDMEE